MIFTAPRPWPSVALAFFLTTFLESLAVSDLHATGPCDQTYPLNPFPEYPEVVPLDGHPWRIAAADLDGDGLDEVLATLDRAALKIVHPLPGSPADTASAPLSQRGRELAVGDLNRDGLRDVVIGSYGSGAVDILIGKPNRQFQPPHSVPLPFIPDKLALADFDEDGWLDLATNHWAVATRHPISLLFGDGAGGFRAEIDTLQNDLVHSVRAADMNGDGHQDLVIGVGDDHSTGGIKIFYGDGTGHFPVRRSWPSSIAPDLQVVDLDNDGNLDVATTHNVYLQSPDGNLVQVGGELGSSLLSLAGPVRFIDVNRDGILDFVAVLQYAPGGVGVRLGLGGGRFGPDVAWNSLVTYPSDIVSAVWSVGKAPELIVADYLNRLVRVPLGPEGQAGFGSLMATQSWSNRGFCIGDFDGVGRDNAAVTWSLEGVRPNDYRAGIDLIAATTDARLTRRVGPSVQSITRDIACADLTGDGRLDLVVARSGGVQLFPGATDGTFSAGGAPLSGWTDQVRCADFNGDGHLDVVARQNERVLLALGHGTGSFDPATTILSTAGLSGVFAVGDLTHDGLPDLLVAPSTGGTVRVLAGDHVAGLVPVSSVWNLGAVPAAAAIADLNGDGANDAILSLPATGQLVVLGGPLVSGRAPRLVATCPKPDRLAAGDWNGDGSIDVAVVYAGTDALWFHANDGTGGLEQSFRLAGMGGLLDVAPGDMDGDGWLDLVLLSNSNTVGWIPNRVSSLAVAAPYVSDLAAEWVGAKVRLRWSDAVAVAGASFELQRRVDGGAWTRLGPGSFSGSERFEFLDESPDLDMNEYRSILRCPDGGRRAASPIEITAPPIVLGRAAEQSLGGTRIVTWSVSEFGRDFRYRVLHGAAQDTRVPVEELAQTGHLTYYLEDLHPAADDSLYWIEITRTDDVMLWEGPFHAEQRLPEVPRFQLIGPNPFAQVIILRYDVPPGSLVRIELFDIRGRLMCSLVDGIVAPGHYESTWDGRTHAGQKGPSGVYFLRVQIGAWLTRERVVRVR